MSLLDKEAVKRAKKSLHEYDQSLSIIVLENSAKTAKDAAKSLNCEILYSKLGINCALGFLFL